MAYMNENMEKNLDFFLSTDKLKEDKACGANV